LDHAIERGIFSSMSLDKLDDVSALLRAHLAEEAQAGFPNLSRIPSSSMIKFMDYVSTLTTVERDTLLSTLARLDAMRLFLPLAAVRDQMSALATTDPALLRYRAATQSAPFTMGLRYEGLRMVKTMLADRMTVEMMAQTRATLDFTPRDDPPAQLVPDPDPAHLKPAKAPLLRKLIDKDFKDLFTGEKRKLAGGETGYGGVFEGTNVTLWIDFAGMGLQLRYGVSIPDETKRVFVFRLGYEDFWVAGPSWDYLTEENAEASIHLMRELVVKVVRLRYSVIALMS
jgi:hypothetical protein